MRPQDSRQSGRRPRRSSRKPRSNFSSSSSDTRQAPAPLSLWEKVLSFFKKNGKTHTAVQRPSPPPQRRPEPQRPAARKPEAVEVSSPKLYVGNLSFDATESDLFELFKGVGDVQNAEIVSHRQTQRSKGFGFVTMNTTDEARRAVTELHDKDFMGRKLVVSGAKTGERNDRDEPGGGEE